MDSVRIDPDTKRIVDVCMCSKGKPCNEKFKAYPKVKLEGMKK